jgi:hypothetical protein
MMVDLYDLKRLFLLFIILITTFLLNADDIDINKYSVLIDNEPESKFKIVIWDNIDDLDFKYLNKLNYNELKRNTKV